VPSWPWAVLHHGRRHHINRRDATAGPYHRSSDQPDIRSKVRALSDLMLANQRIEPSRLRSSAGVLGGPFTGLFTDPARPAVCEFMT
jgi:hypothetical protein